MSKYRIAKVTQTHICNPVAHCHLSLHCVYVCLLKSCQLQFLFLIFCSPNIVRLKIKLLITGAQAECVCVCVWHTCTCFGGGAVVDMYLCSLSEPLLLSSGATESCISINTLDSQHYGLTGVAEGK